MYPFSARWRRDLASKRDTVTLGSDPTPRLLRSVAAPHFGSAPRRKPGRQPVFCGLGLLCAAVLLVQAGNAQTPSLPLVAGVDLQPLAAQLKRLTEALDSLGAPLSPAEQQALQTAVGKSDANEATEEIQRILDAHCLVFVTINPEIASRQPRPGSAGIRPRMAGGLFS